MSETSQASVTIEAPVAAVREILFNLADYPSWSSSIKSVKILRQDDQARPTQVELKIEAGVLRDRVVLDYDWSTPDHLSFSLSDADLLTEMTGAYSVQDLGDETTKVSYELTVNLSMPVPAMMRQKQERATIEATLKELQSKIEQ